MYKKSVELFRATVEGVTRDSPDRHNSKRSKMNKTWREQNTVDS